MDNLTELTILSEGGGLSRIDGKTDIPESTEQSSTELGSTEQESTEQKSTESDSTEKDYPKQEADEAEKHEPLPWTFGGSVTAKERKAIKGIVSALEKGISILAGEDEDDEESNKESEENEDDNPEPENNVAPELEDISFESQKEDNVEESSKKNKI